jgi:hypothetical protein
MAEFVEQNYEWLIIFLVYNNNYYDLESQDTTDYYTMKEQTQFILNQIRNTKYSKKVKTIFVEIEIKNKKKEENTKTSDSNPVATLSILRKKKGTWLSAVDGIWREREPVDTMTNTFSLEKVLTRLKDKYNANKHMVITAGHGSILGINYYMPKLLPKVDRENKTDIEKILKKEANKSGDDKNQLEFDLNPISGVVADDLLFLSNEEITEAIKNVFKEKKVDVLVMYNCLMQNIFTQYELRENVDWLVAPLSGISIPGFNYGAILNEISANPSITGELVSELFINSIRAGNYYTSFKNDIEKTWKISAVKINKDNHKLIQEKFENLFLEINNISKIDIRIIYCINETIRFLFNYSLYCLNGINNLDLGIFLKFFSETIKSSYKKYSTLLPLIENLQNELTLQSSQYVFEGTNFYSSSHLYLESNPGYKKYISNTSLLFPFRIFQSDLIDAIYNEDNYLDVVTHKKCNIPTFLNTTNYAQVIRKLLKLPQ